MNESPKSLPRFRAFRKRDFDTNRMQIFSFTRTSEKQEPPPFSRFSQTGEVGGGSYDRIASKFYNKQITRAPGVLLPRPRRSALTGYYSKALRQSMTDAEQKLWTALRSHRLDDVHFRRQFAIGIYISDFCAPGRKLIVEIDGGQHLDQAEYDAKRTRYFESFGFKVLRFWNDAVLTNLPDVLDAIQKELEDPPPASPNYEKHGIGGE